MSRPISASHFDADWCNAIQADLRDRHGDGALSVPVPVIRGITILKIVGLLWLCIAGFGCVAFTVGTLVEVAVPGSCLQRR